MRAVEIRLLPDQNTVTVRTLNFGMRRIPCAAFGEIEYSATQFYASQVPFTDNHVYEPTLLVQVQQDLPIRIDLQGQIVDESTFKRIFQYDPHQPTRTGHKKRRGRDVPR